MADPDSPQPNSLPPELPPLREVIARHGLSARKSLGQHFLFDRNLTGRIARAAGPLAPGTTVEIGPGPGGLTRALLLAGAERVVAVERDSRCLAALAELAEAFPGRLEIVAEDALTQPLARLGTPPRRVVANLPYNISTRLLAGWLHALAEDPGVAAGFTLMFQKEVAQRLTAGPGSRTYGRLSILTQWLCEARTLFDVPKDAFTPPPKVTSSVVQLIPRPAPLHPAGIAELERVTAAAFGQRRKMLRQSLKALGDAPGLLAEAGLDPTARAESLDIAAFCTLARVLSRRGQ